MKTGISRSLLSQHSLATLTAIRLKQQLIHMPRYIDRREFVGATQLNYLRYKDGGSSRCNCVCRDGEYTPWRHRLSL